MPAPETIVVLDFGSQYSQLIARRVRECHVYSRILPYRTTAAELAAEKPAGIILSGGPASVYAPGAPQCDPGIFALGIPGAGHLLRPAIGGADAGREGRARPGPRIRARPSWR